MKRTMAGLLLACLIVLLQTPYTLRLDAMESPFARMGAGGIPGAGSSQGATYKGLQIRLSEGTGFQDTGGPVPAAVAHPLSSDQVSALMERLPPLQSDIAEEKDFLLGEAAPRPPTTGATVPESFPPTDRPQPPQPAAPPPLEVLRSSPEGDIPLAAKLSVTFSQPMVSLGSQDDTARSRPVRITPEVPGHWRWAGTQTILFEPSPRFPMATEFRVEIPAGTRSAIGGVLPEAKTWTFKTPPLELELSHPSGNLALRDPVMVIAFNQNINPTAVLKYIRVSSGQSVRKVRLATDNEIYSDEVARQLTGSLEKGRWIAFRIADRRKTFPLDSTITATIDQGAPSAEGPLRTLKPLVLSFRTYGPFESVEHGCGRTPSDCTPSDPFVITFNNPIDEGGFNPSQVRIEPEIPGVKVEVHAHHLKIIGPKKALTDYSVVLKNSIRDRFMQHLDSEKKLDFQVGKSFARLFSADYGLAVLDPFAPKRFSVYSLNHSALKVQLFAVGPEDWEEYAEINRKVSRSPGPVGRLPGKPIFSGTIAVKDQPEQLVETAIDLSPALPNGFGHVLVFVEPTTAPPSSRSRQVLTWVEVTGIGLDAFVSNNELLARATSLTDGKPLEAVEVTLRNGTSTAWTSETGLAGLPFQSTIPAKPSATLPSWVLVARKGPDTAILPKSTGWWSERMAKVWEIRPRGSHPYTARALYCSLSEQQLKKLQWFVFDDRGIYRPGEEVHVKGWLRAIGCGADGDVELLADRAKTVTYTLESEGDTILEGACDLDASGGFSTVLKLPAEINLGEAHLRFQLEGKDYPWAVDYPWGEKVHEHTIQVEEFRRPEFEVSTSVSQGTVFTEDHAEVTATASYFAGGPLANAGLSWNVTATPTDFTPPNRSDFTFGKWVPWWQDRTHSSGKYLSFQARTGGTGKHTLRMDFAPGEAPVTTRVTAEATVEDVNRQEWSASSSLLVHPASLYVGLKSPRPYVERGQSLLVQCIVTDLDGNAVPGREVRLSAVQVSGSYEKGRWVEKETDRQERTVLSASDPVSCEFTPGPAGRFCVTATVEDDRHRRNRSELSFWIAGTASPPARELKKEEVVLIPDRKEYQPGETAILLVQAPFYPAQGLLTLRRGGLVSTENVQLTGPSTVVSIPIQDSFIPNVFVQLDLVGATVRTDDAGNPDERLPKRPAFASAECKLSVPPLSRKLRVEATPLESVIEPGGKTSVHIEVKDPSGNPVADSQVALVVVDEAVLSLVKHKIDDPMALFYPERYAGVRDYYLRDSLVLADPASLGNDAQSRNVPEADARELVRRFSREGLEAQLDREESVFKKHMKNGGSDQANIGLRTNLNPLAIFSPALTTNEQGRAHAEVTLPDNLTRYRVTAIAVAGGKRFGIGESALTARLPLMVRPSAPRFLNLGDRFEFPAIVQNQTDTPMEVSVGLRAANAELAGANGLDVTVPANDRVEVRFPAAASRVGTARFQVVAASGQWSDAAEITLPVCTPATTEAFATYGQIDEGTVLQPVRPPRDVNSQFGGLDIETSSTQLQALTDALLYLTSYPFECAEQISSRIIAVASLRNLLTAFSAEGLPSPEAIIAAVERDIRKLHGYRNTDGGFGFWGAGDGESYPYVSIHVAHALVRARNAGFDIPDDMLEDVGKYLIDIERHIPSHYGERSRAAIIAYSLYTRNLMGSKDLERARNLIKAQGLDGLSMESIGWLLPVLSGDADSRNELDAIRTYLRNRVTEEAATAHFVTSYDDSGYLLMHSDRRTDGVMLDALISDQPKSDLIPKLVRSLLAHRKKGRWSNTQENAFILIALDRYFSTYERLPPDFLVRAWIGEDFAGSLEFRGRSTEKHRISVPMRLLKDRPEALDLLLQKEGTGRLYYRLAMKYAPSSLKLDPADHGFKVERIYQAVDDAADVVRETDGTWRIRAGSKVRVRLKLVAPARRYHVALVDYLPAGVEPVNPALATTASVARAGTDDEDYGAWRSRYWFDHQNLRDERAEAFSSLLYAGVYEYSYLARATTPGEFVAPPPKAEEMYYPETFGRGATDRVVVK